MTILDRAIVVATRAHSGGVRKGGHTPYILHPLEAAAICATMTDDLEVLAAAVLHDTVEDTAYTAARLEADFGPRVAALVAAETEDKRPQCDPAETWRIRKQETICRLQAEQRIEVKMLTLSDKLSNLRAMYQAFLTQGSAFWACFHQKDPLEHCWYYRQVGVALESLRGYPAWEEYWLLYHKLWPTQPIP
ncbi:MAG: HD domain-containing protein [Candidatus Onthomonas sp.]